MADVAASVLARLKNKAQEKILVENSNLRNAFKVKNEVFRNIFEWGVGFTTGGSV